jgi:hypothetical protein
MFLHLRTSQMFPVNLILRYSRVIETVHQALKLDLAKFDVILYLTPLIKDYSAFYIQLTMIYNHFFISEDSPWIPCLMTYAMFKSTILLLDFYVFILSNSNFPHTDV